jgi:hypothetical protein
MCGFTNIERGEWIMKKSTKESGKLLVAQVYWNADQAYKLAEAKRGDMRDLALVAIPKGETVGPVEDDLGMGHWLTHGEKERVEMDASTLFEHCDDIFLYTSQLMEVLTVNTAQLKEKYPQAYARMLKHKSTRRTTHSCLTWGGCFPGRKAGSKAPVTRRKGQRI